MGLGRTGLEGVWKGRERERGRVLAVLSLRMDEG